MVSKGNAWMIGLGAGAGLAAYVALRPRPEADLAGQAVLITGGSRGLGLELARQFLSLGCKVAICGRDEEQLARARNHLVERPEASPYAEVFAARCDVSDRDQVEHFVREVNGRFGRIDILVANAGIIAVGPIDSMQLEDFEQAMSVMFWGVPTGGANRSSSVGARMSLDLVARTRQDSPFRGLVEPRGERNPA